MKKGNTLYTTITTSDFNDVDYIHKLINLDIGLELALLTDLSGKISLDLENLKKEMKEFCHFFEKFDIQKSHIRIHQPGNYMYYWSKKDKMSGFESLSNFFDYCYDLGFQHFVIHAPYGKSSSNEILELCEYRKKLDSLVPHANLEVEEISTSNEDLIKKADIRFYTGELFEKLMKAQKAVPLLDVYECGGIEKTICRLQELTSKGFKIKTIHMHKDKHKFLTSDEFEQLLESKHCGNFVNEGFIRANSSFDQLIKTKSPDCIVSNNQRIKNLKSYNEKGVQV